jgi:hypothetical protein
LGNDFFAKLFNHKLPPIFFEEVAKPLGIYEEL